MARGWARSFRWAALDIEMGRCLRKAEGDLAGLRTERCTKSRTRSGKMLEFLRACFRSTPRE